MIYFLCHEIAMDVIDKINMATKEIGSNLYLRR